MNRPVVACVLGFYCCSVVYAAEQSVSRSQLPAAVQKTVDAQSQGATIKRFTAERENGKKVYEAAMIVDGHTRDVQIAPDGSVQEVEEEVPFDQTPANVQTSLKTRAGRARIVKVESLTKQGKLVAFEAQTIMGTHKGEVQVGPDGLKLDHEE